MLFYTIKKHPDTPHSFVYQPDIVNYIVVRLTDSIHAYNAERKVSIKEKAIGGEIENNLTVDAQNAGISQNATYQIGANIRLYHRTSSACKR